MARTRSRRTRSPPATSSAGSGASRRSRSSSPSARSCPWAEPGAGAVATQAYANPRYGPDGLALLRQGLRPRRSSRRLTEADDGRDERQLGVVDAQGRGATYTGADCLDWAGGRTGDGYAAQGNILVSGETVDALAESFEAGGGLARRAPARGARGGAGGRRRQARAAVGRAARRRARRRLRGPLRHRSSTCASTTTRRRSRSCAASTACTSSCSARRRATSGSPSTTSSGPSSTSGSAGSATSGSADWAGVENLEERVDGDDEIDPVVLSELRRRR